MYIALVLSALLVITTSLGIDEYVRRKDKYGADSLPTQTKAYMGVQCVFLVLGVAGVVLTSVMLWRQNGMMMPRVTTIPIALGGIGKPSGRPLAAHMF